MTEHLYNPREICPSSSSNPVSLVKIKSHVDPVATTNIQVSTTSFSDSDSDIKLVSHPRSPSRTSRSSTNSMLYDDNNIPKTERISNSSSHSKLTDLAHKVTDYLFSTRRSIDFNHLNSTSEQPTLIPSISNSLYDSSNPSPIASRDNSHVSLSSLARTNGVRPVAKKRRSFLLRPNHSPPREASATNNHTTDSQTALNKNTSSISLSSNISNRTPCHFLCNDSSTGTNNSSTRVKETHYVHVEYDPITRKRVLNTYEILQDLGAGQHGKVKLAKDTATGNLVAIKIVDRTGKPALMLSRSSRGKTQTQEDKIRKEIAIMKKCDHPHVVKLIEVLDAENSRKIYMVLEYLEKGEVKWQLSPEEVMNNLNRKRKNNGDVSGDITVDDCVNEPLLSLEKTKQIFRDVLSGLEYLHHQGIIHRDIKPSNLLVGKDDEVKISDFGVSFAANLDDKGENDFELAKTAGTPAFLAPELCGTERCMKVTYKIDIWALGITLFCLIFGCLPFHADSEFQLFDIINHNDVNFPDMKLWRVAAKLSDTDFNIVKDLLLKLLDKNPESRIEIDEIRRHPFVVDNWKEIDEYAGWNKNMKIDVSNEEVDGAVVGLGNRIKKRISDAFKKRKAFENNDKRVTEFPELKKLNLPFVNLKDDCSYILSEKNNNSSEVSLSLLNDNHVPIKNQSKSTTCVNVKNVKCTPENGAATNNKTTNTKSECFDAKIDPPLCSSSPTSDNIKDFENLDRENSDSDEYDYRNDLELIDEKMPGSVNLTVNPSFASLDSFYDDSYSKFLHPNAGGYSNYIPVGSYSGRNNIIGRVPMRMPTNTSTTRSPTLGPSHPNFDNPSQGNFYTTHAGEVRDSLMSFSKDSSTSKNKNSSKSFMQPNLNNNLRGKPINDKGLPVYSPIIIQKSSQRSPTVYGNVANQVYPANPMLFNSSMNTPNSVSTSSTNRKLNDIRIPKRAVFSNMTDSDSDYSDDDNNDNPIEFNKNPITSSFLKGKNNSFSGGGGINANGEANLQFNSQRKNFDGKDDYNPYKNNNDNIISDKVLEHESKKFSKPDNLFQKPLQKYDIQEESSKTTTKSSIYGTKLNLLHHSFDSDYDSDDNNSENEELFLSFGNKNIKKVIPDKQNIEDNKMKKNYTLERPDAKINENLISAENVFTLSTPEIVDVPANIIESQNNLLQFDDKNRPKNVYQLEKNKRDSNKKSITEEIKAAENITLSTEGIEKSVAAMSITQDD